MQSAAGKSHVTPIYYRHGHRGYHHRPYRYHRGYGYSSRQPYYYGAYAYQPEGGPASGYAGYSYQPDASSCPYYGSNDLWWCH